MKNKFNTKKKNYRNIEKSTFEDLIIIIEKNSIAIILK